MANSLQRRLRVLVTAAAVGLAVWKYAPQIPGYVEFDRAVFELVTRAFANPPFFVSGNGSHEQPWTLRMLSANASGRRAEAPTVISIGDDVGEYFVSSPPAALDYAVFLRNLKRLGVEHVAIPALMAWKDKDPWGLMTLDSRLADFKSAVTAAPLSRGTTVDDLPLPFYRASIPVSQVTGDPGSLPQVNCLAQPGTYVGSGKTLAGFSLLESEKSTERPFLMARWKDRIVFAFPVIAAFAESGQEADQIEVRLGSYLKLGPHGPVVPIDGNGCLVSPCIRFHGEVVPPQSVISGTELKSNGTVMIRDDRTSNEPAVRQFSETVANTFTSITTETGLTKPKAFARLSDSGESLLLIALALLSSVCAMRSGFRRRLAFGLAMALVLIAQFSGLAWASLWLPLYPSLVALAAGYLVAWPVKSPAVVQEVSEPSETLLDGPVPILMDLGISRSEPEPPAKEKVKRKPTKTTGVPAKKVAKKAAKKAAAPVAEKAVKKVAKKATSAKKAAKKTAATGESPPVKKAAKKAAKKAPKPPVSE